MADTKTEQYIFNHEQMGAASYRDMEYNLSERGNGKWLMPTTSQTLQFSPIRQDSFCWTSTKNLWTPEGIIVYDDPEGKMPSDAKSLTKLYEDGNPAVRFVKSGLSRGSFSISDFIKNPFVVAQIGNKDLMEMVAERAQRINPKYAVVDVLNHDMRSLYPAKDEVISGATLLDSFRRPEGALYLYGADSNRFDARIYGYMEKVAKSQ